MQGPALTHLTQTARETACFKSHLIGRNLVLEKKERWKNEGEINQQSTAIAAGEPERPDNVVNNSTLIVA